MTCHTIGMKYVVLFATVILVLDFAAVGASIRSVTKFNNCTNCKSTDLFNCAVSDEKQLVTVKHCVFEDNGEDRKKLSCSLTIHITDTAYQNIEYRNYLQVTLFLEVLENQCLELVAVLVSKTYDVRLDSNIYKMGDIHITELLNGISELNLVLQTTHPLAVGISSWGPTGEWCVKVAPWILPANGNMDLLLSLISEHRMNISVQYHEFGGHSAQKILPLFHKVDVEYLKLNNGILRHNLLLPSLSSLTSLNVAHCSIEVVPDGTFHANPNLKHLNLAGNLLPGIPSGISTLEYLETLDLSDNPLVISPGFSFILPLHQLQHLQALWLSHIPVNNLDLLRPFLLTSGVTLSELHLSDCNISAITEDDISILKHQTKLKILDMSNNMLTSIPKNLIQPVQNITVLNLSMNYLHESPQLVLDSELDILDLSHNYLTSPVNITHLGGVGIIDLSRNNISKWNYSMTTPSSSKIKCLNISHNFIETVNEAMIYFFKTLQCIDLGGNPLNCQICDIFKLSDWYQRERTVEVLSFNVSDSLSCSLNTSITEVAVKRFFCSAEAEAALVMPSAMLLSMIILAAVLLLGYKFEVSYFAHLMQVKCDWFTKQSRTIHYDAFVCYSGSDRAFVFHELVQHLEKGPEKYRLCLHDRDFVLGRYITQNIMNFLQESRKTIVVVTTSFIKSQWCNWELEMVKHKLFEDGEDFLIFLDMEHVKRPTLPRHLRYLMSTQTYIKWPSPFFAEEAAWARLKAKLGDSLHMKKHRISNA